MLVSYNQKYEKIAMGLLSYIADLKSMERLQTEMESYTSENSRKLYLWRDSDTENIVAIIGIECSETMVLIRHLAVSPSFRNEGIIYNVFDQLQNRYPEQTLNGTLETALFVTKWAQRNKERINQVSE